MKPNTGTEREVEAWDLPVESGLGKSRFCRSYLLPNRPVLIKGYARDWPSVRKWSLTALAEQLGDEPVTITYSDDRLFDPNRNLGRTPLQFEEITFAAAAQRLAQPPERGAFYMHERVMDAGFRRLCADFQPIDLIPPLVGRYVPRLWVGGAGASSPLHYDGGDYNFLVHIAGAKRFDLYSPDETENLYANHGGHLPHLSMVDHLRPDHLAFPRYGKARRVQVYLEPGDMLYVPSNWWHATESLSLSISANFWFTMNRLSWLAARALAATRKARVPARQHDRQIPLAVLPEQAG